MYHSGTISVHVNLEDTKLNQNLKGVAVQWCNPLTLRLEQSGRVGSIPGRAYHLSIMTRGADLISV